MGGVVLIDFGGYEDIGTTVTVDSQDRILLTGRVYNGSYPNYYDIGVARLDSDGNLDTSFDGDGTVTSDFGNYDYGLDVAVGPDGKITVFADTSFGLSFVRYNDDGSLDDGSPINDATPLDSFGTGGRVTFDYAIQPYNGRLDIDADGNILVAGYAYGTPLNSNAFAVARYDLSGSLDTGFGVGGRVVVDIGSSDDASTDVDVGADGRIVLVGYTNSYTQFSRYDVGLVRLSSDGSLLRL